MTIALDTLDYARKLEKAGVPLAQAEQQSMVLAEGLGKSDPPPQNLATLERNLTALAQANKAELKNDIALLGQKLSCDIGLVRSDFNLVKWMLGTMIASISPSLSNCFCTDHRCRDLEQRKLTWTF